MKAVLKKGSKQYICEEGKTLSLDLMDVEEGKELELKEVLVLHTDNETKVGAPYVDGCSVKVKVVQAEEKGPKVISYKYKRRKNCRVKKGHRQKYTKVQVLAINS